MIGYTLKVSNLSPKDEELLLHVLSHCHKNKLREFVMSWLTFNWLITVILMMNIYADDANENDDKQW